MIILGIETSCDDTCVSVCKDGAILSNMISSQIEHEKYGGILPEQASRLHLENIEALYGLALQVANIQAHQIDNIAFTSHPGLIGSLLVGMGFAKGLALALNKDAIPINHIEAHMYSCLIEHRKMNFPFISLTISGGHTNLSLCNSLHDYTILGKTKDDAVGEVLDKAGRMLGFPFPAGKHIDECAKKGDEYSFSFPKTNLEGFHFSFSGLKTAMLYFLKKQTNTESFIKNHLNDICASYQKAVFYSLSNKVFDACEKYHIKTICINGGVSANSYFKQKMYAIASQKKIKIYFPHIQYCTDNAAMVAHLAYLRLINQLR